jgi:hypothetical protein
MQVDTLEYSFAHLNVDFEVPSAARTIVLDSGSSSILTERTITSMKVGEETEESKEALNTVRENVMKYWKDLQMIQLKI